MGDKELAFDRRPLPCRSFHAVCGLSTVKEEAPSVDDLLSVSSSCVVLEFSVPE